MTGPVVVVGDALLDVDQHFIPRQMRGQRAMVAVGAGLAPRPRLVCGRIRRVLPGLAFRNGLLQILDPEQQLIGVQLLGAAAELMAQQTLDQQVQLVDLGIALLHRILQDGVLLLGRGNHLAQQVLQRCRVVGQGGEVDLHANSIADAAASAEMNPT